LSNGAEASSVQRGDVTGDFLCCNPEAGLEKFEGIGRKGIAEGFGGILEVLVVE
jgi:hypothetical protein